MNRTAGRLVGAGQLLIGTATAWAPATTVRIATGGRGRTPDVRIVRVLGLRQIAQGAAMVVRPTPDVFRAASLVDAAHAASLIPVILADRRHRPAAVASTMMGAVFAFLEARVR